MCSKPLKKTSSEWSPNLAYAIGLLVTDGSLSKDGRHLDFTSKDKELINIFLNCLSIQAKVSLKKSGKSLGAYYRTQWSDVVFYKFLESIGLMPNKTKIIEEVKIPNEYFFDFLRGHLDGDGTFYSYWDKRWKSSYMFYTVFISASEKHLKWLQEKNNNILNIKGHFCKAGSIFQLKYAKAESLQLLSKIYYNKKIPHLPRKRIKINRALKIINIAV
jgi:hypothetical protein